MCSVLFAEMAYETSVVLGEERCLPAWTRRREVLGRFVRRARSVVRVEIVVLAGMERGIAEEKEC